MAGPTPVSALIHAATMVTAGVYMIARMHAVYLLAPAAMAIVAVVGAATALFAAIIGFAQNDFKKVLAYSTVSQLGFMFAGVGTGELRRRRLPPRHARVLQGRPVPRRRLGDARDERLGRHHDHGRPAQEAALDARRVLRLLARDLRHPVLLGLLLEGRDPRGRVRDRDLRPGEPRVGRQAGRRDADAGGAGHGVLHVAPLLPGVLGRRDARRRRDQAPHPRVAADHDRAAGRARGRRAR